VWLYSDLTEHPALQYLAWISLPVFLVLFSAGFVHILAPQAIGMQVDVICSEDFNAESIELDLWRFWNFFK
jgi:hypothetical protein